MRKENKVRVQLDLFADEVDALDAIRDNCGLRSRADSIRTALAVLEWVTKESQKGKQIFAVGSDDISHLVVPGLTKFSNNHNQE